MSTRRYSRELFFDLNVPPRCGASRIWSRTCSSSSRRRAGERQGGAHTTSERTARPTGSPEARASGSPKRSQPRPELFLAHAPAGLELGFRLLERFLQRE